MTVQLRQNAEDLANAAEAVMAIKGGIARGTLILTARGEVAVETLVEGDRIITRERGIAVLKAVEEVSGTACTIRTDSLGLARPSRDTTVAADQHVIVRDWRASALFDADVALVPAERLADGAQVATFGTADFFRLSFDRPLTVYANGLETPVGRTEAGVIDLSDSE